MFRLAAPRDQQAVSKIASAVLALAIETLYQSEPWLSIKRCSKDREGDLKQDRESQSSCCCKNHHHLSGIHMAT